MRLSHLKRPLFVAAVAAAGVCAALSRGGRLRPALPTAWKHFSGGDTVVDGRIVSGFVDRRPGRRYLVRLEAAAGRALPPVRVVAYVRRSAAAELRPGQSVRLFGKLRLPRRADKPGGFDEREFVHGRGAALLLHARAASVSAPAPWYWRPWVWGDAVHRRLDAYWRARLPAERAGVVLGLLLGYKDALPPPRRREIQDAGVMHLLTPSGAKVTLLLAWIALAGLALGLAPAARLAAALAAGGAYLLVVGPEPPYTRAYAMAAAAAWAWSLRRIGDGAQLLALAAAATLLVDARAVASAGFLMSYTAMAAIVAAAPHWRPPRRWPPALRIVAAGAGLCLLVQTALVPLFAGVFGRASLIGVAVNLVLVPLSGPLSALFWLCWLIDRPAAAGAAADAFVRLCAWAAARPGAAVTLAPWGWPAVTAYYCAWGALLLPAPPRCRLAALLLAAALAAADLRPRAGGELVVYRSGRRLAGVAVWPGGRVRLEEPAGTLDLPGLRVMWAPWGLRAIREGKALFCIINSPTAEARRQCPDGLKIDLKRQGPLRAVTSEENCEITLDGQRDQIGCAVS